MIQNKSFYIGSAIHNITRPNFDYIGAIDNYTERRITIQSGGNFLISNNGFGESLRIIPHLVIIKQKSFSQLNAGLGMSYGDFYLGAGLRKSIMNYKNSDASIFSIGVIKNHLRISYSYEHVISQIRNYAPTTHEFGLQLTLKSSKNRQIPVCNFPSM